MEAEVNVSEYELERGKPMPSKKPAFIQKRLLLALENKYGGQFEVLPELKCLFASLLAIVFSLSLQAQETETVILNQTETHRLQELIATNQFVSQLYDSISHLAIEYLDDDPRPLKELFYEGMLDTNPQRIDTEQSLKDLDKINTLIYACYGTSGHAFALKAKEYVLAWAAHYLPTGNTINENKFVPLFWAYYLFQDHFSETESERVKTWMEAIAHKQMSRKRTPNNNWEAKRLKIIGTIGCILKHDSLKNYSINGFKTYIQTAYYADGTSNDLKKRDALQYHNSGLKPTLSTFINCSTFDAAFELFDYVSPSGSSIRKSVAYSLPYATGEKTREEWRNTQVELDKRRAAAGIAKYQPGKLFDPKDALPLFAWAGYFEPDWYDVWGQEALIDNYTASWIGMLNSPLIREHIK